MKLLLLLMLASCASYAEGQDLDFNDTNIPSEDAIPKSVDSPIKQIIKGHERIEKLPFCKKVVDISVGYPLCRPRNGKHACFCLGNAYSKKDLK